jgi:predicted phage terminase large subunit-like protein
MRFICSSYSADLSVKHSVDRRTLILSDWYQSLWSDRVKLAADQNLKGEYQNDARGVMVATSTGAGITGKGADFIVVDDPHSPLQALSDLERKTALRYFDQSLATRLDDPSKGCIVLIMQRLHEEDLTGHLLEKRGWEHLNLPAVAERYEKWTFPISGRIVERRPGELLWPQRFPQSTLDALKKQLGSNAYAGQYQQRPVPEEGGLFHRGWFRIYTQAPTEFKRILFSVDSAYKIGETNDYTSCTIFGTTENGFYLLHELHERLELPDLKRKLVELAEVYGPHDILVEDCASGQSLIQELKSGTVLPIRPIKVDRDKVARANSVTPLVEAGRVFVPDPSTAAWVNDYLDELCIFPAGQHDDRVDSTTQFLNHVRQPRTPHLGLMNWYEQELKAQGTDPASL